MKPLVLLLAMHALLPALTAAEPVAPVSPAQLLAALPAAPAQWNLTRSQARSSLNETVESSAVRHYQASPADGGTVEFKVTDTGGTAEAIAQFNPAPDAETSGTRTKLDNHPAITHEQDGELRVDVLVAERFLLKLTFRGVPKPNTEAWIRQFQSAPLLQLPKKPARPLPAEVQLTFVDQLNPQKNRSYSAATHDRAGHAELLKSKEYKSSDPES